MSFKFVMMGKLKYVQSKRCRKPKGISYAKTQCYAASMPDAMLDGRPALVT